MDIGCVDCAYKFVGHKVIIRLKDRVCETPEELLASNLFREVLVRYIKELDRKGSPLLALFGPWESQSPDNEVGDLIQVFQLLTKMPIEWVNKLLEDPKQKLVQQPYVLFDFVEGLYNFWREFERFMVLDSEADTLDKRPYRAFNSTIESLTHLVRHVYRDIQENISGKHPNIYRQIHAGAEVAAIALPKSVPLPEGAYQKLTDIPFIRQILIYPPLLLNPPMNKRTGSFKKVDQNPLDLVTVDSNEWLCYPARVGPLLINVYFHEAFFELGFSLCNLLELADDSSLQKKADAIYLFGVPEGSLDHLASLPTVFYEDEANDLLVGAVPRRNEFGYFGYLKKMILTLHNIKRMKMGKMPFHGALVRILLKNNRGATILLMGETGTGKSETLEAFRTLGDERIREMVVIADDMGSLDIDNDGKVIGYGTEVGAFVRLDDLQPGYAFGQLDRTIIMNPSQVNARVVLPVTTYDNVVRGYPVDMVLYANNYEEVDEQHPIIEQLNDPETALNLFREGVAMSKGTTTSTGLVRSYFVNIFGPDQYKTLHEVIAKRYFQAFYKTGIFVGQLRTRLGIAGWERQGPEGAARMLLKILEKL